MHHHRSEFHVCQANRYLTRNAGSVVPVFLKLSMTRKSLHFMGPKVWNSLPDEPKSINSFGIFKREINRYFKDMSTDS